ncbi:MAG TPA: hypothetical protein VMM12_04955 [Longimicrobiales bacterium]|nr:hypothetical protein [Longimicrobiales bacterium]
MRQPLSWQRGGAIALVAVIVLLIAALVLDSGTAADMRPVVEYMEARGRPPAEAIADAGRAARVVLLSDIRDLAGPKRVAADAIRALAAGPGLDAVVLAVSSDEQPYIDAFLNAPGEDATVLLNRPAAVRESDGVPRAFLDIYSAVYRVNQELGAARRIRILAVDVPGWPPPAGANPDAVARLYASRTEHMLARMDEELLSRIPEARLLVFMDGYMTLQRTHGVATFAGGDGVRVDWLGERLRERTPGQVRTVLLDAAAGASGLPRLPAYQGTIFHHGLRRDLDTDRAVRITDVFSGARDPVLETSSPTVRVDIGPDSYTLRDAADVYVFLARSR